MFIEKQHLKFTCVAIFVLIASNFSFLHVSNAALIHTMSDKISRHAPSTAADHELSFTTLNGIGEAGDYLRISFNSGFDLSSISVADIDMSYGLTGTENNLSLAATANATNWGVNIDSGNSLIEFTHPTDALFGDIGAGDAIKVFIGTNASGGTNQIINPATTGSKVIDLDIYDSGNNIIDQGRLAQAIFQDQVGVSGVTGAITPVILDPPFNIVKTSMELHWSEYLNPADFDRYELYMSLTPGVTSASTLLTTSSVISNTNYTNTGLSTSTTYYYMVVVYNDASLSADSNEVNATTLNSSGGPPPPPPPPPLDPPEIDDVQCPFFTPIATIYGTRVAGVSVYVNGSIDNVSYPADTTWSAEIELELGSNTFYLYARNEAIGLNSNIVEVEIVRWRVGDTNGNFIVDDFDLAGLAWNWQTDWCFGDFKRDYYVDDFDLAGLAGNWDGVY